MNDAALYCEIEPYVAQWMRNLIDAGHIAPGVVDERSLEDLDPEYVSRFSQAHFCAGISVWSFALRQAGWPDHRRVWTASLPCQPFSASGQGAGFADERHLWPSFHYLVQQCRPAVILGEQVASKDAEPWLDLVSADLEALGYAFGAFVLPAAGVGAENLRERTYWCAHTDQHCGGRETSAACDAQPQTDRPADWPGRYSRLAYGPRTDCEWITCADGYSRPIEPGLCAVVDEYPSRVGRLRAYGNAINAEAARVFIECVIDTLHEADK